MHDNNSDKGQRVVLVGVHTGTNDQLMDTTDETMNELEELAQTAGLEVVGVMIQNRAVLEKATYLGSGKLIELKNACEELNADLVVFDDALTGSQIRNIDKELGITIMDRNMLILDIFAQRASTSEGKIQVELAQLKYLLPRLSGMGAELSRQGGSNGGGVGPTRGPGETKLETDRRHIHRKINLLKESLEEIKQRRDLIRNRRKKDGVLSVALVGYTNSGKSTLMNNLTGADVTMRNRLFETLDPTSRSLILDDNRSVLIVDTVGFIRRLPHHFIEAFKSTLEEAVVADVLVHVIDASNPQMLSQIDVVDRLLSDLGCLDKPVIAAFNKRDISDDKIRPFGKYTHHVSISALTGEGIEELKGLLGEALPGKKSKLVVLIPYTSGDIVSKIHENEIVISEDYTQEGTKMEIMVDNVMKDKLKEFMI